MIPLKNIHAALRRLQTWFATVGKSSYLSYGRDLHVGKGTCLWASKRLSIGNCVYIGKQVHIEANCTIGNYCLIANRVAIVVKNEHDFMAPLPGAILALGGLLLPLFFVWPYLRVLT